MYKIENISYQINKKIILSNIGFQIKPNKFLSIVGPNGCGKSTLIKLINKNLDMQNGVVYIDDMDIETYSVQALAKKRAILSQSFYFPYNFKVLDILEMGLYVHNLNAVEKNNIIDYIIEILSISKLLQKDYLYLSGGEKQIVQFARVLIQLCSSKEKEKYLFLDEPTLNLDISYQYKILEITKKLQNELKIGICAILHDINQAYCYSDEIILMKNGQIKYNGNTTETLTQHNIQEIFNIQSEFIFSKKLNKNVLIAIS